MDHCGNNQARHAVWHGTADQDAPPEVTRTVDAASGGTFTTTAVQHDDMLRAGWVAAGEFARVLAMLEIRDREYQALRTQLAEAEAHNTDLIADATRLHDELARVRQQLARQTDTLAAERRYTATHGGRS
jgi:hypothetical protein